MLGRRQELALKLNAQKRRHLTAEEEEEEVRALLL